MGGNCCCCLPAVWSAPPFTCLIQTQATALWRWGENRWVVVSAQETPSWRSPAQLMDLQLPRSWFHLRCPFAAAGQVRCRTVILSCHMQEVWGERSCCQCFSLSPLKGIKGTALDAICTAEGRSVCQDLGAAAGLCTEFGPKMARTAVRWDWGTSAGNVGKFWSGASVIYSGLVTSSLSYWTCQRHKNVVVDSLTHPTVFPHLCHIQILKSQTSKPRRCSEVPQWLHVRMAVMSKETYLKHVLPRALTFGMWVVAMSVLILGWYLGVSVRANSKWNFFITHVTFYSGLEGCGNN